MKKKTLRILSLVLVAAMILSQAGLFSFAAGSVSISGDTDIMAGETGRLRANVDGDVSGLQYSWSSSNPDVLYIEYDDGNCIIQGVTEGSATVTVNVSGTIRHEAPAPAEETADAEGSEHATGFGPSVTEESFSDSASVTVRVKASTPELSVSAVGNTSVTLNAGGESAALNVSVTGGTGAYSYQWTKNGNFDINDDGNEQCFINSGNEAVNNGTVTCTVRDLGTGESKSVNFSVTVKAEEKKYDKLSARIQGSENLTMYTDDVANLQAMVSGGSGNYSFEWDARGGISVSGSNESASVRAGSSADRNASVLFHVYDRETSEDASLIWYISVESKSEPLSIEMSRGSVDIAVGNVATLYTEASGGTGNYSYSWSSSNTNVAGIIDSGANAEVKALGAGKATVTVTVSDGKTVASKECLFTVTSAGKSVSYNASASCSADQGIDLSDICNAIASSFQSQVGTALNNNAEFEFVSTSSTVGKLCFQDGTQLNAQYPYQFSSIYATAIFEPYTQGTFTTKYNVVDGDNIISGSITFNVSASKGPKVSNVTISPTRIDIETHSSRTISIAVTPSDAKYTVSWSSSNTNVATLSGSGNSVNVTSTGNTGNSTITATVTDSNTGSKYQQTCVVYVTRESGGGGSSDYTYNPRLTVTNDSDYYGTGISDAIAREFYSRYRVNIPADTTIRFSYLNNDYGRLLLSNGNYAQTSRNYTFNEFQYMYFTPYRPGTWSANYSLSYGRNTLSGTMYVTVQGSSNTVVLSASNMNLPTYSNQYLYATITGNYRTIVWTSNNTSVVSISGSGNQINLNTSGKTGTARITCTVTDYSGIQTIKSCDVTVSNNGTIYNPTAQAYIGSNTKGTSMYDSLRAQFKNIYGQLPTDAATIKFTNTGDQRIAIMKLANGRNVSANTNYTMGDFKAMYPEVVSAGKVSVPYTLTYNGKTLTGTMEQSVMAAPVTISLALPNSASYLFSTALQGGAAGTQITNAINSTLQRSASTNWSYVRFSTPSTTVGTLYSNSSRGTLTGTTNINKNSLNNLFFIPATSGTYTTQITAYNSQNNVVAMGTLYITVPGSQPSGKIDCKITDQPIICNGKRIDAEVYNINGANYFKLRDLAAMMNGTRSQFSVGWDNNTQSISIMTGYPYQMLGTELIKGKDKSKTCYLSNAKIYVNGTLRTLTAYNIGDNNYFQLREMGSVLGFNVNWNEALYTVEISSY